MGNLKLVLCCIAGILLGFLAPLFLSVNRSTSLSVGMVLGLAAGYVLDMLDEKKGKEAGNAVISQKARKANQLMEQARAELSGRSVVPEEDFGEEETGEEKIPEGRELREISPEEESAKLNEAEELLRKARERIR